MFAFYAFHAFVSCALGGFWLFSIFLVLAPGQDWGCRGGGGLSELQSTIRTDPRRGGSGTSNPPWSGLPGRGAACKHKAKNDPQMLLDCILFPNVCKMHNACRKYTIIDNLSSHYALSMVVD